MPVPFRVPYPRNPLFVGRAEVVQELAQLLDAGATPVLTGTGGQGKTQVAVALAYTVRDRYPGGVFWLTMERADSVAAQVAACGAPDVLALPGWEPAGFETNLAFVRAAWQQDTSRLLIFDNCEDPAPLREWPPRSGRRRAPPPCRPAHRPTRSRAEVS